jgi:hypothetical protein
MFHFNISTEVIIKHILALKICSRSLSVARCCPVRIRILPNSTLHTVQIHCIAVFLNRWDASHSELRVSKVTTYINYYYYYSITPIIRISN